MPSELGASFAPTNDNALDAKRRGSLEGLPQAIQILSMRMPRFLGARGIAPEQLLNAPGAQGADPFLPAVIQTMLQTLAPGADQDGGGSPFSGAGITGPVVRNPKVKPGIENPPGDPSFMGPPDAGPDPFVQRPRPIKDAQAVFRSGSTFTGLPGFGARPY